jgi:hypothetical protein
VIDLESPPSDVLDDMRAERRALCIHCREREHDPSCPVVEREREEEMESLQRQYKLAATIAGRGWPLANHHADILMDGFGYTGGPSLDDCIAFVCREALKGNTDAQSLIERAAEKFALQEYGGK